MKIVFWGSSEFSLPSLKILHDKFHIVAVLTNPDRHIGRGMKEIHQTPMKQFALQNNIMCIQPESLKESGVIEKLKSVVADLFVVVSYGKIIPDELLYLPCHDTINLHASLLPMYRGASPIHKALLNNDNITGNTVQFIIKELDKGDVVLQTEMVIGTDELFPSLHDRLADDGAELLVKAIDLIKEGKHTRTKQDHSHASYCRIIKKHHAEIDFVAMNARTIYNKYRAYYVWPQIYSYYGSNKTKVIFTEIRINNDLSGEAGTILRANKTGLTIACADGAIDILSVKPAGKKLMDYKSFINGYKPIEGSYFNIVGEINAK